MTPDRPSASPGVRELKKRETRVTIELAAATLALEFGADHVTVAQICAAAGISRSTFFNYMPSREAAIYGRPLPLVDADAVASILAASATEPLTVAALRLAAVSIGESVVNRPVLVARMRMMAEQVETRSHFTMPVRALFEQIGAALESWLVEHPEARLTADSSPGHEAMIVATIAGLAFSQLLERMSIEGLGSAGSVDSELTEQVFAEALHEIAQVLRTQVGDS